MFPKSILTEQLSKMEVDLRVLWNDDEVHHAITCRTTVKLHQLFIHTSHFTFIALFFCCSQIILLIASVTSL